ncbi:MAG: hypothetical protein KAH21_04230, partial [Spirochaetaceae bacterium]|nr:hypothetical protein [Spirochaetaceae bacterium]
QGDNVPPMLPSILYARLALQNPLVIAGVDEEPHNVIFMEVGERVIISIEDRNGVIDRKDYPVEIQDDPIAATAAFDELSDEWAPLLGLVTPDVTEEREVRREKMTAEISYEEKLITPYQATLWLPLAARQSIATDGNNRENKWIGLWPLRADFAWFFNENLGIISSFRFEYGNHLSFGIDPDNNPIDTTVLMLMPGIGFQVRTLGKLSAEFGITLFLGAVHIKANETADIPSLSPGESSWGFYPVVSLEPAIVWSPTTHWSVKARILEFQMGLKGFKGSEGADYGMAENTIILNYLQLGAAYRW